MSVVALDAGMGGDGAGAFGGGTLEHEIGVVLGALHQAATYNRAPDPASGVRLRAVCRRARQEGVGAAQLLVLLKRAWRARATPVGLGDWERSEAALERVVTLSIQAYYLPPPGGLPDS